MERYGNEIVPPFVVGDCWSLNLWIIIIYIYIKKSKHKKLFLLKKVLKIDVW